MCGDVANSASRLGHTMSELSVFELHVLFFFTFFQKEPGVPFYLEMSAEVPGGVCINYPAACQPAVSSL